jgi:hypothetical protein
MPVVTIDPVVFVYEKIDAFIFSQSGMPSAASSLILFRETAVP